MFKNKRLLIILILFFLLIIPLSYYLVRMNSPNLQNQPINIEDMRGYKNYVLRLNNPTVNNAVELTIDSLKVEAYKCNCLQDGFPQVEQVKDYEIAVNPIATNRVIFSQNTCDSVDIPAMPDAQRDIVEVFILSKNPLSSIDKGNTLSIYVAFGTLGECSLLGGSKVPEVHRGLVLSALKNVGAKGFEEYD